ncbi:MAG: hypothetical protein ACU83U_10930 [Gammaproteobacteria bacterium]
MNDTDTNIGERIHSANMTQLNDILPGCGDHAQSIGAAEHKQSELNHD